MTSKRGTGCGTDEGMRFVGTTEIDHHGAAITSLGEAVIDRVLQQLEDHDGQRCRNGGGKSSAVTLDLEAHWSVLRLQSLFDEAHQRTNDLDESDVLTRFARQGLVFEQALGEAQQAGYAEADPSADVDGYDARSKLALLAALAFGERITPGDIFVEGIRRVSVMDFDYAHQLKHTIRLVCSANQTEKGLLIAELRPNGPAEKAGLRGPKLIRERRGIFTIARVDRTAADLIVGLDDQKIANAEDFLSYIEGKSPGDEVHVTVIRDGRKIQVALKLATTDPNDRSE